MATSVPSLTLIPIVAFTKAGASLIPSPTIITFLPLLVRSLITEAFFFGKTLEITLVIPNSSAIDSAVTSLSPVNIITSILLSLNLVITSFILDLTISLTPIRPITIPSSIT